MSNNIAPAIKRESVLFMRTSCMLNNKSFADSGLAAGQPPRGGAMNPRAWQIEPDHQSITQHFSGMHATSGLRMSARSLPLKVVMAYINALDSQDYETA